MATPMPAELQHLASRDRTLPSSAATAARGHGRADSVRAFGSIVRARTKDDLYNVAQSACYYVTPREVLVRLVLWVGKPGMLVERFPSLYSCQEDIASLTKCSVVLNFSRPATPAFSVYLSGTIPHVEHAIECCTWLLAPDSGLALYGGSTDASSVLKHLMRQFAAKRLREYYIQFAWIEMRPEALPHANDLQSTSPEFTPRGTRLSVRSSEKEPNRTPSTISRSIDPFAVTMRSWNAMQQHRKEEHKEVSSQPLPLSTDYSDWTVEALVSSDPDHKFGDNDSSESDDDLDSTGSGHDLFEHKDAQASNMILETVVEEVAPITQPPPLLRRHSRRKEVELLTDTLSVQPCGKRARKLPMRANV